MVEAIPGEAAEGYWQLLSSLLSEPGHPEHDKALSDFSAMHGLETSVVVRAMETCDAVITGAVALDLTESLVHQDVQVLAEANTPRGNELVRHYAVLRPHLRRRVFEGTLADHGNVLVGLDWRLDQVDASDRGSQINTKVMFLTLAYHQGDEVKRLTLQLNQEGMRLIKAFADRFSG